ncbi:hypothetical protein ES703_31399 [subsurface metagenome]
MRRKKKTNVYRILKIIRLSGEEWVDVNYIYNQINKTKKQILKGLDFLDGAELIKKDLKILHSFPVSKKLYVKITPKGKWWSKKRFKEIAELRKNKIQ